MATTPTQLHQLIKRGGTKRDKGTKRNKEKLGLKLELLKQKTVWDLKYGYMVIGATYFWDTQTETNLSKWFEFFFMTLQKLHSMEQVLDFIL